MSDTPEHTHGHMVHERYVALVREQVRQRRRRLERLSSRADAERYAKRVRRRIRRSFGPEPQRTPLNTQVTGRLRATGYSIQMLRFESRPGFFVTANLYVPEGTGPFPAVLGACGHGGPGKAEPAYQRFCVGLVRRGFVVLIYDPVGQGERSQYAHLDHPERPVGPVHEHQMAGHPLDLTGGFLGAWRAWDGVRALDVLLEREEVDPARVGLTGNSGGGTMTTWLNALDERFTFAAPSCFVTTFLANLENELPADSEQCPPGILAAQVEMADFFLARAPRPVMLLTQRDDFFDPRGTAEAADDIRRVYRLLGAEADVEHFVGPDAHGFHRANRRAMYDFFCRQAGVKSPSRPPRTVERDPQKLRAAPGEGGADGGADGVAGIAGNRFIHEMTAETARALAGERGRVRGPALRKAIGEALALPERDGPPHHRLLRPVLLERGPYRVAWSAAVETEPGIRAILHVLDTAAVHAARSYRGGLPDDAEVTLHVPHVSSRADAEAGELAETPPTLLAVDPRGIGRSRTLTCEASDFFEGYGSEYFYASHSAMLGESYLGGRVHDVLRTLDLVEAAGARRVHLCGRGMGAITAALVGCLHEVVKRVTLTHPLLSWQELTEAPVQRWPRSAMARGVLERFDLPDCYRELARRKGLELREPWNRERRPWRQRGLEKHLAALGLESGIVSR